ncbi:MAG: M14 family metallopeptidase [Gemmatimonadota bacterium]|nr:M14 family metallopeptidase [Gemmatimonadota bacterium]
MRLLAAVPFLLTSAVSQLSSQTTRAERSKYTETSTYADVVAFIDSLQAKGALVVVGSIGQTTQGRDLPFVIASRPLVHSPAEAKRLGRPIVYVQGNIHAGEVEGKEALQALLRDLVLSPRKNVLDSIVLIAVPIYNADGNEVFKPQAQQRGAQNGPEMVGQRPNAKMLDLNRDYVKAEAAETRASLQMFNTWDPDVFVDLHTTDGSYHGYALTYAPSLHPAAGIRGGPFGGAYARDSMLPVLRARVRARHRFETFDYGNFTGDEGPAAPGEAKAWSTYDHRARYGVNYYALRGRLAFLSEAYSHDPFERRVKSTYAFVTELLSLTAERSRAVLALTRGSDAALAAGKVADVPVRAVLTKTPSLLPVIEEPIEKSDAPPTEPGVRRGFRRSGTFVTTKMPVRDRFDVTRAAPVPWGWVIAPAAADTIGAMLRLHGVRVVRTTAASMVDGVQCFAADSTVASTRAFQGHRETRFEGRWVLGPAEVPAGALVVTARQPLGVLAQLLLDPNSDDGFGTWNLYDAAIARPAALGGGVPVCTLTKAPAAPARLLP